MNVSKIVLIYIISRANIALLTLLLAEYCANIYYIFHKNEQPALPEITGFHLVPCSLLCLELLDILICCDRGYPVSPRIYDRQKMPVHGSP